jgi:asparagine synthase (glutamine-hydrolysing)
MAARCSSEVRTFSIGFPGYGKLDETSHARLIASHFGTRHTELMVEPTIVDLLPILVRQFDEPMVDSSMFPTYLVSHLVRQHCAVALGGDGGDELFGGYVHYRRLLWMERRFAYVPIWLRYAVAQVAERFLPVGFKHSNYLLGVGVDLRHSVPLVAKHFGVTQRRRLLRGQLSHPIVAESIYDARTPAQQDLLQRATRMDFENYLAEDILVKVDRASMLNSLEVRAPFLDYRVIEFAFGRVPSYLKVTELDGKVLLKRLATRVLPPTFDKQRKQGFSIPLGDWLKGGPFRELFWSTLTAADCFFDVGTVRSLLNSQDAGYNNSERLFALVQFELWRKAYNIETVTK